MSCHDLRHTFATRYLESISISNYAKGYKALSSMLGHKSISTTLDLYSHLTDDSYDELNHEFEDFMNNTFTIY